MAIRLDPDDLAQCIHCGMCLEACPTYRITGLETESPRGRIHLMGALAAGTVEPRDDAVVHLDRCLACRACEAVCPSGVRYGRLIETTRAELRRTRPLGPVERFLLRGVVARPAVLSAAAAVGSLYERLGIRRLVRATGIARRLPRRLRRLESLYPPLTRPRYRPPERPAHPTARVALLLGCVMRVAYGDVHTAAARVLSRYGSEVVEVPDQACCGALHAHSGDEPGARALARRAVEAFERAEIDAIVVDAAGCGAHLKGIGGLLADEPEWASRAAAVAAKVRDVTEHLARIVPDGPIGELRMRVTYQDPCHLAHAQGIRREPRALLAKVSGLEVVEMPEADVCCGSAGTYNVAQPDYADRLIERKVANIAVVAPDAVVTANPGCMLQIEAGLRAAGRPLPVLHVVEILDRAGGR
ncbi:MAG TPA: heterodisulfide reductase-related iron-sulfur binding cluster [Candidatus Limnocylindria bacterium]|nr:heterodisulfide reductase-related iron-sulfur binding cluster [Candidatus Limnocylindria bacterium]